MKIRKFARCLAALAMFASVGVHANLVTNGGFETGDFTGWSLFGAGAFDGVDGAFPQSGSFAAFFGEPLVAPSGISQTLATTAGKFYTISFWLANEADVLGTRIPNSFAFNWNGGAAELTLSNVLGPTAYTHYSFTLLATSALTDLRFTFASDPAFWDFDTVSVDVVNAAPEPGSLALVVLGGGMIAAFKRRRRQA
jgi:hypothetical protein